jgi:uncharacterized protein YlzI (FlbEa/FlbD family)
VIMLTRFPNGDRIAFNPDLIERAEQNPDTVITLSDGSRYVVGETVEQIIDIVQHYRARVLALAHHLAVDPIDQGPTYLHLVRSAAPVDNMAQLPRTTT